MTIIVTGAAGFIGYHVAEALLARGKDVMGIDNLNDYYDVRLKEARLERLITRRGFRFQRTDLADRTAVQACFERAPDTNGIIHLAAQAGVRYSLIDPYAYVHSNVLGHLAVLEAARRLPRLEHLVYASSSSVYGANQRLPFAETDRVDAPLSMYAVTKRADELMGHVYGHLFGLPQTGLRFFTVYGPWGRPDMAYYTFARAIMLGEPITLYEGGRLKRDFTYIDDIVAGVLGCLNRPPPADAPARVLNIGNNRSETVSELVALLEESLGRKAVIRNIPRPPADVVETYAAVDAISALTGFSPVTRLSTGIPRFVAWFLEWHGGRYGRG
ncbi:MAG: NAD-dependent epimerase/dehydratase family protein [Acetobacteraceae bacterium]|nr:NAD-dependent epimerase/dehydratase family protein [Acetobacteraceae bacterium]